MVWLNNLLFIPILLGPLAILPRPSNSWQRSTSPRLENLTDTEIKYAKLYWNYDPAAQVVHTNWSASSNASRPQIHLGYRFVVPLPERLAGLTYVGHAARLRLVLERARNGHALRVGALGGSITWGQAVGGGHGSYVRLFMDWLNIAMPPLPRWKDGHTRSAMAAATATATATATAIALDGGGGISGNSDDVFEVTANGRSQRRLRGTGVAAAVVREGTGVAEAAAVAEAPLARVEPPPPEGGSVGLGVAVGAAEQLFHVSGRGPTSSTSSNTSSNISSNSSTSATVGWRKQHPFHIYLNGAVPGTQSSYMSSCLQYHLPPAVDLVFVEYAVNDSPSIKWNFADPSRRAFERLIRKLLRLPSKPAVVLVNMFAVGAARGNYLRTSERDFMEFATYYSLPAVSLKAAVLPSAYVGGAEQLSLGAIFNGGVNHPGRGGHVVVTELLITLCQSLLRSNAESDGSDPCIAVPVTRMHSTETTGNSHNNDDAAAAASASSAVVMAAVANRPLPPPLADANYESMESTCYIEHDLRALVQQPVEGWEWTDEGRQKWGYVATESGKTLRIKLNTLLEGNRSAAHAAASIVVQIAYLQSYLGMGTAQVSCVQGCQCQLRTIDSYDSRPVSVTSMEDVTVSQHPECIITLTTTGPSKAATAAARNVTSATGGAGAGGEDASAVTTTPWSKFKLTGLVVGEEPGAPAGSVTWLRDESHELAKSMHQQHAEAERG